MLGVYSCPQGNGSVYLAKQVVKQARVWTAWMSNAHLPATLGWMLYRFKLWSGLRYGIATLATPLDAAHTVLEGLEYKMLSFLGVNRNIN